MMAASLLTEGCTEIRNVPRISDVFLMAEIIRDLGCRVIFEDDVLMIDASGLSGTVIPEETVGKMRSSSLLLGPLLSRGGEVTTWYPGGCVIGKRPIDFHLDVLRAMGAEILDDGGMLIAKAETLCGTTFRFPYPSVGATENAVMAAVLASGTTKLLNCAREPEIAELCGFLRSMGAKISGERTGTITVTGVEKLFPTNHVTAGDRICAGTYLAAAAASGGEIEITGVEPVVLVEPLKVLRKMGAGLRIFGAAGPKARIRMVMERRPAGITIDTGPYPGFPTDMQSVFLAAEASGTGEPDPGDRIRGEIRGGGAPCVFWSRCIGSRRYSHNKRKISASSRSCRDTGSSRRSSASRRSSVGRRTQRGLGPGTLKARI